MEPGEPAVGGQLPGRVDHDSAAITFGVDDDGVALGVDEHRLELAEVHVRAGDHDALDTVGQGHTHRGVCPRPRDQVLPDSVVDGL